jgi:hypothetical protein
MKGIVLGYDDTENADMIVVGTSEPELNPYFAAASIGNRPDVRFRPVGESGNTERRTR